MQQQTAWEDQTITLRGLAGNDAVVQRLARQRWLMLQSVRVVAMLIASLTMLMLFVIALRLPSARGLVGGIIFGLNAVVLWSVARAKILPTDPDDTPITLQLTPDGVSYRSPKRGWSLRWDEVAGVVASGRLVHIVPLDPVAVKNRLGSDAHLLMQHGALVANPAFFGLPPDDLAQRIQRYRERGLS